MFRIAVLSLLATSHGTSHGLAQTAPPERFVVELETRSFDLRSLEAAVRGFAPAAAIDHIVAELERCAARDQKPFAEFVAKSGGRLVCSWWLVNACAIELPRDRLDAIRAHPRVRSVVPDRVVECAAPIEVSTNSKNHRVDALQARGIKGRGVTVAVMDTGLDADMRGSGRPHRSFFVNGDVTNKTGGGIGGSRIVANRSFGFLGPEDRNGHGTGVAAIAAGETWATRRGDAGHAPLAHLAGYGIANDVLGRSSLSVITTAWQAIAGDKGKHGILVANNSYTGSSDPTSISQQALDAAARAADILVVVAAGNEGRNSVNSQSAANGLAVGAVDSARGFETDHTVASFSSRGPLLGDPERSYPDLVANGVGTVMPRIDSEARDYVANGTSMAAPQVAGAAALFRSVRKQSNALETKAAILASTDDLSERNPRAGRNDYGTGYLRDDRLVELAQGKGLVARGELTGSSRTRTFSLPVVQGRYYAVVLAWHRHVLSSRLWSNVDLEVRLGSQRAYSSSTRNLYEKVVFRASTTGTATLTAVARSLDVAKLPVAVAATEVPPRRIPGDVSPFGTGCAGTGKPVGVQVAAPASALRRFGGSDDILPFGIRSRMQVIYARAAVPASFQADGLFFRQDEKQPALIGSYWVEMEVKLGLAQRAPAAASSRFADNVAQLSTVLSKQRVNLPNLSRPNPSPATWGIRVPFTRPFPYKSTPNRFLLLETVTSDTAMHPLAGPIWIDAVNDSQNVQATRVATTIPTSSFGSVTKGRGAVVGFTLAQGAGATPVIGAPRPPAIADVYRIEIEQAAPRAPVLLALGVSDASWGPFRLPLDLGPAGAPGCFVRVSLDHFFPVVTDAGGRGSVAIFVPPERGLVQGLLFHQAIVIDAGANRLGVSVTAGLRGFVGGRP